MKRARKCPAEEMPFDVALLIHHAPRLAPDIRDAVTERMIARYAWEQMTGGRYEGKRRFRAAVDAVRKLVEWTIPGRVKRKKSAGPRKGQML